MPLLKGDIRIFKSDTMNDTDSGGGDITAVEVVSGQSNNIFDDVSPLSRVFGNVSMRKVFPSVFTQDVLKYYGSHTILSKMPKDEMLDVNLFNSNDWHDRRSDASSRVESYRAQGGDYFGFLFGTQYAGSKVVTIFQNVDSPISGIGDVLFLHQESTNDSQYIKILELTHDIRTFTVSTDTFVKRIVELRISQPLASDFIGSQLTINDALNPLAKISKTVIANSGKYYSTKKSTELASIGDTSMKVDSIFSQLVPSSLQETPVVNVDAFSITGASVSGSTTPVSFDSSSTIYASSTHFLGSGALPTSLSINTGGADITDLDGKLISGGLEIGIINYSTGTLNFNASAPTFSGVKTFNFIPTVDVSPVGNSGLFEVTDANRGLVYAIHIDLLPAIGSVSFSFRSFGNTYILTDNGSGGMIADDDAIGSGTIAYNTGDMVVTLGALPDVGTDIIIQWGETSEYLTSDTITSSLPVFKATLTAKGIDYTTVAITWNDGIARSASINADGFITGDASGFIEVTTGEVTFTPNVMFNSGTTVNLAYDNGDVYVYSESGAVVDIANELVIDIGDTNILPNSVSIIYFVNAFATMYILDQENHPDVSKSVRVKLYDNGLGQIIEKLSDGSTQLIAGSAIDYATGIMSFNAVTIVSTSATSYFHDFNHLSSLNGGSAYGYGHHNSDAKFVGALPDVGGVNVTVDYRKASSLSAVTTSFQATNMILDLIKDTSKFSIPSSMRMKWLGEKYVEIEGKIYKDFNTLSGSGILAGTYNFATGEVSLNQWDNVTTDVPTIESLVLTQTIRGKSIVAFQIPSAPVRVQSFNIVAVTLGGVSLSASADANGIIDGFLVKGVINVESGTVEVSFGEIVVALGNETEPWYDAGSIFNGNIWRPVDVDVNTVKYNAVSQTFIPLDPSILGLDAVRLPEDGRVPVYSKGDICVIRNVDSEINTYASNTQTDLGRTLLSSVTVVDNAEIDVDPLKYTYDLATGLLDWLDLTGVSQPITVEHEIEDIVLLNDVQITGALSFNSQLTHDYPVVGTLVSSAMIHGDVFASVNEPFDQKIFTGEWSDTLIGDPTTAELNLSIYPIEVTNASCIEERWIIQFTNSTTVNIIGETVGQIITGAPISSDITVNNPSTGFPYLVIDRRAFGGGWSSGNIIRFNTSSANKPIWIIQSVKQGAPTNTDDDALLFCLSVRGASNST
jgi:hypothetical protein